MNVIAVSAAVSALVTVVVGTLVNWGERIVSWGHRRAIPDHAPIRSGMSSISGQVSSSTPQVRVLVAAAPNRSLRRQAINPDDAITLIKDRLAARFPDEPVQSMPGSGVKFESGEVSQRDYVWVSASGRIDLCIAIDTSAVDLGPIAISLLDVIAPILDVLAIMQGAGYRETFPRSLLHRRIDWSIAVSQTVYVQPFGSRSWDELKFPGGAAPPRAGTQQQAYCPRDGYASAELQNWRIARSPSGLVRIFLRDFLYQNGFHNVDDAMDDTIRTLDSRQTSAGTHQRTYTLDARPRVKDN
jgi:hypothetical protein